MISLTEIGFLKRNWGKISAVTGLGIGALASRGEDVPKPSTPEVTQQVKPNIPDSPVRQNLNVVKPSNVTDKPDMWDRRAERMRAKAAQLKAAGRTSGTFRGGKLIPQ